jgi:Sulfotransferase domain
MNWPMVSRRKYENLSKELEQLRTERDGYKGSYQRLDLEIGQLRTERDGYKGSYQRLDLEVGQLRTERDGYKGSYEILNSQVGSLRSERDGYKCAYHTAADELGNLRAYGEPPPRSPEEAERMAGKPSIFVVCQPKAGTKYLGATLARTLGYDYGRNVVTHTFPKSLIWSAMAHDFLRGGMISASHLQADVFNLRMMKEIGLTKGVIQFRDPRAALYSEYHYFVDHEMYRRYNPVSGDAFLELNKDQQLAYHVERFFKPLIGWIGAWVDVLDTDRELNFLVTTHEELASDEQKLFSNILAFYGIQAELNPARKNHDTHFRSGSNSEWRSELSPTLVLTLNSLIPKRLWDRFGWDP